MNDIRKYSVAETSVLHLRDAEEELMFDDKDQPVTVTLFGPGSKAYAKAQAAQSNRVIDKIKRKGKTNQSAEEQAQEKAEFLAACTHSMQNVDYEELQGEALYKAVYSDISIGFIADQVAKHLGEWGNFSKALPKP